MRVVNRNNNFGVRSATVQVGSSKVRYQVLGSGEPLVLVHGLAGSTAWWSRNVHVFSRCYTVYLVDLPGFGAMYKYADQFSIHKAPEWLRALLAALRIERAYIVGHSMGGLIAALFAARWPEFAPKIVLAAPAIDLSKKNVTSFFLPLGRQVFYTHPR